MVRFNQSGDEGMIKIYRDDELIMQINIHEEDEEDFIYEIYRLLEFFNKIMEKNK